LTRPHRRKAGWSGSFRFRKLRTPTIANYSQLKQTIFGGVLLYTKGVKETPAVLYVKWIPEPDEFWLASEYPMEDSIAFIPKENQMTPFYDTDQSELDSLRAQVELHERESGIPFFQRAHATDTGILTHQVLIAALLVLDIVLVVIWGIS
jgi:hypothetical protein